MGVAVNLTINRTEYQTGFTKVPNSLIHSQKISMKAKMLMTYLIGQRDSSFTPVSENDRWTMTLKGLSHVFKESIGCIKRCMDELMREGFVVRVDVLSKRNLRIRSEYVVFEEPIADVDGKPRRIREEELNKGVTLLSVANPNGNVSDAQSKELEKDACREVVKEMIEEDTLREEFSPEEAEEVTDATCLSCPVRMSQRFWTRFDCEKIFEIASITSLLCCIGLVYIKIFLPENAMQLWMRCNCCSLPCAVEN